MRSIEPKGFPWPCEKVDSDLPVLAREDCELSRTFRILFDHFLARGT